MGTLSVKFDGKSALDWTGDKAEIDGLGAAFRTAAKNVKLKPDVFADNAVRHFAESGFITADPIGQEMQMMAIAISSCRWTAAIPRTPARSAIICRPATSTSTCAPPAASVRPISSAHHHGLTRSWDQRGVT